MLSQTYRYRMQSQRSVDAADGEYSCTRVLHLPNPIVAIIA